MGDVLINLLIYLIYLTIQIVLAVPTPPDRSNSVSRPTGRSLRSNHKKITGRVGETRPVVKGEIGI
jgi:hypothetical protein